MTVSATHAVRAPAGATLFAEPGTAVKDDSLMRPAAGSPPPSNPSGNSVRWWAVVVCMMSIARMKHWLRRRGFARTLRRIRERSEPAGATSNDWPTVVALADRTVALAAAFYPGRALCLERSLVLYNLLRRKGIAVELKVGVQATPFAAHAWVAYCGEPVNDSWERVSRFVVVPEAEP